MQSPGRVIPRQRLLEIVWGRDRNVDSRSVDVYMSRLRDKIEGDPRQSALSQDRARNRILLSRNDAKW